MAKRHHHVWFTRESGFEDSIYQLVLSASMKNSGKNAQVVEACSWNYTPLAEYCLYRTVCEPRVGISLLSKDCAAARAQLMNSSATGLSVRFFSVKIATGLV